MVASRLHFLPPSTCLPYAVLQPQGDAEDLPFPTDSFDRYVSAGSIEYWPEPQRGICEVGSYALGLLLNGSRCARVSC